MQGGKAGSSVSAVAGAGGVTGGSAKIETVLVALRARALDVHARLAELADLLAQVRDGVGEGRTTTWTEFLAKFDALSLLAGQLCDELARAVGEAGLSHYVIHPSSSSSAAAAGTTAGTTATAGGGGGGGGGGMGEGEVPMLLRTRREPELERDAEALAASFNGDAAPDALAARIAAFNAFAEGLGEEIADLRDEHAPQNMSDTPKPRPPAGAGVILAALTTGAGL